MQYPSEVSKSRRSDETCRPGQEMEVTARCTEILPAVRHGRLCAGLGVPPLPELASTSGCKRRDSLLLKILQTKWGSLLRSHRTDVAFACVLFAVAAAAAFLVAMSLDARLLDWSTIDVWFEADFPRVFENMTNRWSNFYRAKVHPLFGFLLYPPVFVLHRVVGLEAFTAVNVVVGVAAGLWVAGFFALLRLIGCRRLDALLLTLVAATSATAVFWFAVPETHMAGSLAILLAMLLVAAAARGPVWLWLDVVANVFTLGTTVTNWMAGIASTMVRRRPSRTLMVVVGSFFLTIGLWWVARVFMPSTAFFLGQATETGHILSPESLGPAHVASSFFLHTMVMPAVTVVDRPGAGDWPIMLVQPSAPGSAGPLGVVSVALWVGLLGLGLIALFTLKTHGRLRLFLAMVVAGQFALHILFGNETFLYAPNFLPLLVGLAALALLTPMRRLALVMVSGLLLTNGVNNVGQRLRVESFFDDFESMHQDAELAAGHVSPRAARLRTPVQFFYLPGASGRERAAFRTGGGFSPMVDEFTVSFRVMTASGEILQGRNLQPSDTPVMSGDTVVGFDTETYAYQAEWRAVARRRWRLTVQVKPGEDRVALVIRGVGIRASPIRTITRDSARVLINERWSVTLSPPLETTYLVDESKPGWMTRRPQRDRLDLASGWATARIELPGPGRYEFTVEDTQPGVSMDRIVGRIPADGARSAAAASGAPDGS